VKCLIIHNPIAGPRDVVRELVRVRRELTQRGWAADIECTQNPGDAILLARQAAAAGLDAAWAAGGDGTINEVVNGLVGSPTVLGILPIGTGNIWARQLHLPIYSLAHPFHLREAALDQLRGQIRTIDVGRVNDRHFLLWAGAGFDAEVTSEIEPRTRRIKRLGALPYVIAAVLLARQFSGVTTHIVMDGRTLRGRTILMLATNTQMYAYFRVTRQARLDDGLLDVFVFKGLGFSYILRHAANFFSGRHLRDPEVVQRQAREITIWSEQPMAVQMDGDPFGTTPVSVRVVPRSLRIFVPPQAPPSLFGEEIR